MRFNKGEIIAMVGHNGVGRAAMLNQTIGITKSTKDSITLSGLSFARDSKITKEYVSMMSQLHAPLAGITMTQPIGSIVRIRGGSQEIVEEECIKILRELKIDRWKDIPGQKPPGGFRRLTSFAMAVVYPSPIVVLDEPINDVDSIRRQKIWRYLRKLSNKGYMIIVVTHNILEVEEYADRYILMNHGKVLGDKDLKKQSTKVNDRNHVTINFLNPSDLKSVIVSGAIQADANDEELMVEMGLENSQVLEVADWIMKLVIERKVQSYRVSPESLNEAYGELIDENDKKLRKKAND